MGDGPEICEYTILTGQLKKMKKNFVKFTGNLI